jgi:hypothetical protein
MYKTFVEGVGWVATLTPMTEDKVKKQFSVVRLLAKLQDRIEEAEYYELT